MGSSVRQRTGWAGNILAWLVILAVTAILAVAVVVPRLAGATPYTVLTGSMSPGMPAGSLVVVRPTDADAISIGDVITYQLRSGEPTAVTHRVVATARNGNGKLRLQTQGDANAEPDPEGVRPEQIRGVEWYSVPYLGHVNNLITGEGERVAVIGTSLVLFAYAAAMMLGGLRDRSRRRASQHSYSAAITASAALAAPSLPKEQAHA